QAPLTLEANEKLELTLYLDKSVIEIFANQRQAITRRVYDPQGCLCNIAVVGKGRVDSLCVARMMPAMPY
ncbi:MAG: GH32 C-terminal domain-containing protein, partial [Clostridia bacterium]